MFGFLKKKRITEIEIELEFNIIQSTTKPEGISMRLICAEKHPNYVSNLIPNIKDFATGETVPARVGSVRSQIKFIRCLICNKTLKGGEVIR